METKIGFVEQNQDFRGQPIYGELKNCPKTKFLVRECLLP